MDRRTRAKVIDIASRINPDAELVTGAALERHRDELIGRPVPPDHTPIQFRKLDPGFIAVEWLGDVSPLGDEQIQVAIKTGLIDKELAESYLTIHQKTGTRMDGITTRTVTPEHGFTRTIRWGHRPGTYIRDLTYKECERLLASGSGREFRFYENGRWYEAPDRMEAIDRWVPPSLREAVRNIQIIVGRPEDLRGLHPFTNAVGFWE